MRRRIPYIVVGGMKFYERAEVKDVLAYLRLAARPEDDLAFRRVVNVPARGIGAATLDRLAAAARESGPVLVGGLGEPAPGLTERARTALARFRAVVARPPREGGDLDALGPARAPARRSPATPRSTRAPRTARTSRAARTSRSCCPPRASSSAATRRARRSPSTSTPSRSRPTPTPRASRRRRDALDAPRRQGPRVRDGLRRRASRRATCRTASPPRTRTSSRRSGACSTSA